MRKVAFLGGGGSSGFSRRLMVVLDGLDGTAECADARAAVLLYDQACTFHTRLVERFFPTGEIALWKAIAAIEDASTLGTSYDDFTAFLLAARRAGDSHAL